MSLDVLFAAESLLPAQGGAERFALELLGLLARRGHRVRALWLSGGADAAAAVRRLPRGVEGSELPAPPRERSTYWHSIRARCEALAAGVQAVPVADVVVTQLHGTPAAVGTVAPTVVLLPSYESLCKVAHGPGATVLTDRVEPVCPAPRDCRSCPLAQDGAAAARRAQDAAVAQAHTLVACSRAVAAAVRSWTGRNALVAEPAGPPPDACGRCGGHVLVAAGTWAPHKGAALVEPIAAALEGRDVVVTAAGLDAAARARLAALGANVRDEPIASMLDGAGVCVVPSQWPEPFGRVAFEAQACGVPVVAPRNGGLAEHIATGQLLDVAAQPADYVAGVRALDDPSGWAQASDAARAAAGAVLAGRPLERAVQAVEAAAA